MNDIASALMELYAGLPRAYGLYRIDDPKAPGKKKGDATTLQEPVTRELWEAHIAGRIQLGIVPIRDDATCVFGAIDVDDYKLDHKALETKIKRLKLPLIMCRSKSGGAHLYGFFAKDTPAEAVRELLLEWAAALGYNNVEIFPKQSRLHSTADTGNWINMPYCGGNDTERYAIHDDRKLSLEEFVELAAKRKINTKHFEKAQAAKPEMLEEGPPCLQTLCSNTFPEGTRNAGLFALGVYCRKRWLNDWEVRLQEMNQKFMSPPLEEGEVIGIIAHLQRKEYSYQCKQPPLVAHCQRALCIKRDYGIGVKEAQDLFGIQLENVVRLEVEPPVYFADFAGKRLQFYAEHINSQGKFRENAINQTGEVLQPVPTNKWYQFMAHMCAIATVVAAPPETTHKDQLLSMLEDYCLEQVSGRSWEDIVDGQTFDHDGRVYFRPHKFVTSINKEHRMRVTLSEIYQALLPHDLRSEKRDINNKNYVVWSLPAFKRPARPRSEEQM